MPIPDGASPPSAEYGGPGTKQGVCAVPIPDGASPPSAECAGPRTKQGVCAAPIPDGASPPSAEYGGPLIAPDTGFKLIDALYKGFVNSGLSEEEIGPTDAMTAEEIEGAFGASPLMSPAASAPSSPSPTRPASPTCSAEGAFGKGEPVEKEVDETNAHVLAGNSKRRRDKQKSKQARRVRRRVERESAAGRDDAGDGIDPQTLRRHFENALAKETEFDTSKLRSASTGYVGLPSRGGGVYRLEDLVGKRGFTLVEWDGRRSVPILDKDGRVIALLAGRPAKDPGWEEVHRSAFAQIQESRERCSFPKKAAKGRRGNFLALNVGIALGPGQKRPGNLVHSATNAKELLNITKHPSFQRISGFSSTTFGKWLPDLYRYYAEHLQALQVHDPSLQRNFSNGIWASASVNFGPRTFTKLHADHNNLPFGWCSVTSLGEFDPTKGGHLVLWTLRLVVEFPAGSTIMLPSAVIEHCNTPIGREETRSSFTQYSGGGLFRWVEHGYQSEEDYLNGRSSKEKEEDVRKMEERCRFGLSMFIKLEDLQKRGASRNA